MPSYRFDRGDWTLIVDNYIGTLYFLYGEKKPNMVYWSMTVTGEENKNRLMDDFIKAYKYFEAEEELYGY